MNEAQLQYLKSQGKINSAQENYLRQVHKLPTVNKTQDFIQDVKQYGKDVYGQVPMLQDLAKSETVRQIGSAGLKGLSAIGNIVERFGAAPMRAGINEAVTGGGLTAIPRALGATAQQFGQDPALAPTGYQVAKNMGMSTTPLSELMPRLYNETGEGWKLKRGSYLDPNPQGVVGAAVNLADPTVFVGGSLTKIPMAGTQMGFKAGGKVAEVALGAEKIAKIAEQANAIASPFREVLGNISRGITGGEIKLAPDFKKYKNIARGIGIKADDLPAQVWGGLESDAAKLEKSVGEGVGEFSQNIANKNAMAHEKLKQGIQKRIDKVAGGVAEESSKVASDVKTNAVQNIKDLKSKLETTYDTPLKSNPQLGLSAKNQSELLKKLQPLRTKFEKQAFAGSGSAAKTQAKEILEDLDFIDENKGSYSLLLDKMRSIGEKAYDGKNIYKDADQKLIYGAIRESLQNSIKSPKLKAKLIEDNKLWSELLGHEKRVKDVIGKTNLSDEQALKKIIASGNKDDINSLRFVLTPEQFKQVKASAVRDLLNPVFESERADGAILGASGYTSARNKLLNPNNSERVKALLDNEEINKFKDLLNLGDRMGKPYMSTSRTGSSMSVMDKIKELGPQSLTRRSMVASQQKMADIAKGKVNPPSSGITTAPKAIISAIKSQPTKQLGRQVYLNTNQDEQ